MTQSGMLGMWRKVWFWLLTTQLTPELIVRNFKRCAQKQRQGNAKRSVRGKKRKLKRRNVRRQRLSQNIASGSWSLHGRRHTFEVCFLALFLFCCCSWLNIDRSESGPMSFQEKTDIAQEYIATKQLDLTDEVGEGECYCCEQGQKSLCKWPSCWENILHLCNKNMPVL